MESKKKRKRINHKEIIGEIVIDTEAFIKNKASDNAKKVTTVSEHIEFDVYFDKHYYIRHQIGDSDGKRDGIDIDSVQKLVLESIKHLLYYSIRLRMFTFVNFVEGIRLPRVVLTKKIEGEQDLNIVVQYHYLKMHSYEVTVVTALRKDGFSINDGDYQLVIELDDSSSLYKSELKKVKHLGDYIVD